MNNENTVYLNGEYLPINNAKISVLDRGFLFGDGVYEVIPAYSGHLFHFDAHIERLDHSLSAIRLMNPYPKDQWRKILLPLLNDKQDLAVYLQVTRGVADKRDHAFPKQCKPTVFAMSSVISPFAELATGAKALTVDDSRWELCNVKATTLLANILMRQQAVEQGCAEAILIRNDHVTEGAASNVFAVVDGVLITPQQSSEILPGITRNVVIELAGTHAIPCKETLLTVADLRAASEIWLTSSTREIVPVTQLDGQKVGQGMPGPVWQRVNQLFQTLKRCHHG